MGFRGQPSYAPNHTPGIRPAARGLPSLGGPQGLGFRVQGLGFRVLYVFAGFWGMEDWGFGDLDGGFVVGSLLYNPH